MSLSGCLCVEKNMGRVSCIVYRVSCIVRRKKVGRVGKRPSQTVQGKHTLMTIPGAGPLLLQKGSGCCAGKSSAVKVCGVEWKAEEMK